MKFKSHYKKMSFKVDGVFYQFENGIFETTDVKIARYLRNTEKFNQWREIDLPKKKSSKIDKPPDKNKTENDKVENSK